MFVILPCKLISPSLRLISLAGLTLLLVSCGGGGGGNDIPPTNQPPKANAGADQTVAEQAPVTLSGSGTDTDGSIAS